MSADVLSALHRPPPETISAALVPLCTTLLHGPPGLSRRRLCHRHLRAIIRAHDVRFVCVMLPSAGGSRVGEEERGERGERVGRGLARGIIDGWMATNGRACGRVGSWALSRKGGCGRTGPFLTVLLVQVLPQSREMKTTAGPPMCTTYSTSPVVEDASPAQRLWSARMCVSGDDRRCV